MFKYLQFCTQLETLQIKITKNNSWNNINDKVRISLVVYQLNWSYIFGG